MAKNIIAADHYRSTDRQVDRELAEPAAPDNTGLTRLKVHTAGIEGGDEGDAYLMLRKASTPYYEATTLDVPLFIPDGDSAAVDDEVWAIYHGMGGVFVKVAGGHALKLGIVHNANISAGSTGQVELCTDNWTGTGTYVTVKNYHGIALPVGLHVRWGNYSGWDYPVVEPFEWTEC